MEIKKINNLEELSKEVGSVVSLACSPINWPIPRLYAGCSDGVHNFLSSLDYNENVTIGSNKKIIFRESEKIGNFRTKLKEDKNDEKADYELYFAGCICRIMNYEIYEKGTEKYNKMLKFINEVKN
jgi:hypothetical protein